MKYTNKSCFLKREEKMYHVCENTFVDVCVINNGCGSAHLVDYKTGMFILSHICAKGGKSNLLSIAS